MINEQQRKDIITIVDEYLSFQPTEQSVPFVSDATDWLSRLKKSIERSFEEMQRTTLGTRNVEAAAAHAQIDIINHLQSFRSNPKIRWDDILILMNDIIVACERSMIDVSEFHKGGGFIEGDAWDLMAVRLWTLARSNGLPSGVSKGSNKSRSDAPSPFVAFFMELQRMLPGTYRRYCSSDAALAQAVSLARRKARKPISRKNLGDILPPES